MAIATDERSVLDRAAEVLAELADRDLDGLTDDELHAEVLEFQRLRGALESAEARVLSRWDARRVWRVDGAKTAAAWLSAKQRLPIQTARQRVRHARAMRTLPEVERAWGAGEIDRTHLITLLGARTPRTRGAFETDHKVLLDAARTMGFP